MNRRTREKLGATIGKILMVDMDKGGSGWRKILRVKVFVDITKPLARGRFLNIGCKRFWISFKYKRLPTFCFHYGLIKYANQKCSKMGVNYRKLDDSMQNQYGSWLRAS